MAYIAIHRIQHNGEVYAAGDVVDIKGKDLERLIEKGAVERGMPAEPEEKEEPKKAEKK